MSYDSYGMCHSLWLTAHLIGYRHVPIRNNFRLCWSGRVAIQSGYERSDERFLQRDNKEQRFAVFLGGIGSRWSRIIFRKTQNWKRRARRYSNLFFAKIDKRRNGTGWNEGWRTSSRICVAFYWATSRCGRRRIRKFRIWFQVCPRQVCSIYIPSHKILKLCSVTCYPTLYAINYSQ